MQGGLSVSLVHKWPASGTYGADDGDLVQAPCKGLCGFLADLRSALPLPGGSRGLRTPTQARLLLHLLLAASATWPLPLVYGDLWL